MTRQGTAVLLKVSSAFPQLLDAGFLEATVLRNFQPLFSAGGVGTGAGYRGSLGPRRARGAFRDRGPGCRTGAAASRTRHYGGRASARADPAQGGGPAVARHPLRDAADDDSLARLIESTVWVNDAHPAYRRACASRSEGYPIALTVAAALAPLTVEPAHSQDFVNTFLARWGAAALKNGGSGREE